MENPNLGKTTENYTIGEEYRIEETQRQRPLVLFLRHTRRLQRGGNYLSLSLSLSCSIQLTLYNNNNNIHQHTKKMCPKSYLYIYDVSAYLHMCPSNRSEPIGTGSEISRFSVSSIRRDMFPNIHDPSLFCLRFSPLIYSPRNSPYLCYVYIFFNALTT